MSQTFISPNGDVIYLPAPMLPIDLDAAAEVWDGALCAQIDPELFFPTLGDANAGNVRAAKRICQACPVLEPCLTTFGPVLDDGIVAGLAPRERQGIRAAARKRNRNEKAA